MTRLTAEELLAGSKLTHEVEVPGDLLSANGDPPQNAKLVLRPLTVRDLQLINNASKDDKNLSVSLMIQQAIVEPQLNPEQVSQLSAGLAQFFIDRVNAINGIDTPRNALQELVQAPLAKACFILAKEFGWTPEEVSGMTIGQILLYLEMSQKGSDSG